MSLILPIFIILWKIGNEFRQNNKKICTNDTNGNLKKKSSFLLGVQVVYKKCQNMPNILGRVFEAKT